MSGNEYIKEFVKISQYALKSGKVQVKAGYIYMPKPVLEVMLQRNNYETPQGKLKVWKSLHWIDCDKDKYTRKVSIAGERLRVVKLDVGVYETLEALFREQI